MADTRETSADVIAAMRGGPIPQHRHDRELLRHFANRFYAALKREKDAIEADALAVGGIVEAERKRELSKNASKNGADFGQLGDCAKLREALESCLDFIMRLDRAFNPFMQKLLEDAIAKAEAALAEPVKNCEVGTADDWLERFSVVCERCSGSDCDHRLFKDEEVCDCFARWAQRPYEEGGAK